MGVRSRLRGPRVEPDAERLSAWSSSSKFLMASLPARLFVAGGETLDLLLTFFRFALACFVSNAFGCRRRSTLDSRQLGGGTQAQPPKCASTLLMQMAARSCAVSLDSCLTTPLVDSKSWGSRYHIAVISESGAISSFATKQKWYSTSFVM